MVDGSDFDLFFFFDPNRLSPQRVKEQQDNIREILSRVGFQKNKVVFHPWDYLENAVEDKILSGKVMYVLSHVSFIAGDKSVCPIPSEKISSMLEDPDLLLQELMIGEVFERLEVKDGLRNVKYSEGALRDIDCIIRRLRFIGVDLLAEFQSGRTRDLFSRNGEVLMKADEVSVVYDALDFIYTLRNEMHVLSGKEEDELSDYVKDRLAPVLGMSSEELLNTFDKDTKCAKEVSENVGVRVFSYLSSRKGCKWEEKFKAIASNGAQLEEDLQRKYANDSDPTLRLALVLKTKSPEAFQALLDYQGVSKNWFIATAIALNEDAPPDVLAQVATSLIGQEQHPFWKQTWNFLKANSSYRQATSLVHY